ncbi:hypothetical protein K438DRAFT_111559 [Mycena galopus ATCC 62051]|nr:hypothetical protein K438DRAFT_111559 [Mycena galopus ATCC 62051]
MTSKTCVTGPAHCRLVVRMDRPDVGDACAFSAPSSHISAVLTASFPHPVLAEATRKPVVLKTALPLWYLRLLRLSSASRNAPA